jgi:hypothetical protein
VLLSALDHWRSMPVCRRNVPLYSRKRNLLAIVTLFLIAPATSKSGDRQVSLSF